MDGSLCYQPICQEDTKLETSKGRLVRIMHLMYIHGSFAIMVFNITTNPNLIIRRRINKLQNSDLEYKQEYKNI